MKFRLLFLTLVLVSTMTIAQVDTSYLYSQGAPLGVLDVRIASSSSDYFYLKEGETFSFRESGGVKTNTYLDMTAWDSHPYKEGHLRQLSNALDKFVMNYRLLVPEGYDPQYKSGYPLVLLLHGLNESGNCADSKCFHGSRNFSPLTNSPPAPATETHELLNNDYNLIHGGSNYLEANVINGSIRPDDANVPPRGFPGFVVVPQNLTGWDDIAVEDAIRIVRLVIKKYNIDEERVYINGISHGGHGAYKAMLKAPWLFAAGVLFSAADDAGATTQNMIGRISSIPLWLFQGGRDLKPTQQQTDRYVRQLRAEGASIRYTIYPELGHGTWNKAFREPDFFSWMLRQRRNNVHVYANEASLCKTSGEGARLILPSGFLSYQWEKDGVVLGANDALFTATQTGIYRGRFLRKTSDGQGRWSEWSRSVEVKERDPGIAEVKTMGTRFLPDPNGASTVVLMTSADFEQYDWYKDKNVKVRTEDTARSVTLNPANGDGQYYVKAAKFDACYTLASEKINVYFADRAQYNVNSPAALLAVGTSPSSSELSWTDQSDNEDGFEVWRRKISAGESGSWTLATVAPANMTRLSDNHLMPSSTYEYLIRAINATGRSKYFPLNGTTVTVTTQADMEAPSAPVITSATQTGVNAITLTWLPSIDNSAIGAYKIVLNGDTISAAAADSVLLVNDVQINNIYEVFIIAVDVAGNESPPSSPATIATVVNGFYYQHSTGAWESLEEIDWTLAEVTGVVNTLTLSPKTQEDFFNFRFEGYLQIRKDGVYQFRLTSNDGSRMKLGDSLVLLNDGIHEMVSTTSPVHLMTSGPHRLTVDFFDYDRSDSLLLEYKGPDSGNSWIPIPSEAFTSSVITDVETDSESDNRAVIVYPNPTTSGNINIQISPAVLSPLTLTILNGSGSEVGRIEVDDLKPIDNIYSLNDLNLSPGLYLLRFSQSDVVKTVRLVIR